MGTPYLGRSRSTRPRAMGVHVGDVKAAGDGVSDQEMADQVASQTSSDLKAEDVFEREQDGATSDTEAAKETADEAQG